MAIELEIEQSEKYMDLNIKLTELHKLEKLDFIYEKFMNGVIVIDLIDMGTYPATYLKKTLNADILERIILDLNDEIKKGSYNKLELTELSAYNMVANNVLVLRLS